MQENNIQNVEEMIEDKIYLTDTECNFVSVAEKLLGDNKIGEKYRKQNIYKSQHKKALHKAFYTIIIIASVNGFRLYC